MSVNNLRKTVILLRCLGRCSHSWSFNRSLQTLAHGCRSRLLEIKRNSEGSSSYPRQHKQYSIDLVDVLLEAQADQAKSKYSIASQCRTHEIDPANHSLAHEGMFYTISPKELTRVFPDHLTNEFKKQVKTFQEACLMVRKPAIEIIDFIKQYNYDYPIPKLIMYGKAGAGKTMTLGHVMHYCSRNNWIIIHVPWINHWCHKKHEVTANTFKPGLMDLPIHSQELLQHIVKMNSHLLQDFKTNFSYTWTSNESTEKDTPLLELINFGLARVKFANDVVGALLKELKFQAQNGRVKVLFALEGVNAFWKDTGFKTEKLETIPSQDLSLINQFQKIIASDMKNAVALCTVDNFVNKVGERDVYTPKALLKKEGFDYFDPFVPVLVPEYSEKEIYSCLAYYEDRLWIQSERGKTDKGKREIVFLSGYNPFRLSQICAAW